MVVGRSRPCRVLQRGEGLGFILRVVVGPSGQKRSRSDFHFLKITPASGRRIGCRGRTVIKANWGLVCLAPWAPLPHLLSSAAGWVLSSSFTKPELGSSEVKGLAQGSPAANQLSCASCWTPGDQGLAAHQPRGCMGFAHRVALALGLFPSFQLSFSHHARRWVGTSVSLVAQHYPIEI